MENKFDKEWLVCNGLGGYASGAINGANTRTYHGLLVAALQPPVNRMVMVAKVEERVRVENKYHDLSTNEYPARVHPDGAQYLKEFQFDEFPCWHYGAESWQLKKSVTMVNGQHTTLVAYKNVGKANIDLEVHPLYAYTSFHAVQHENPTQDFYTTQFANHIKTYAQHGCRPVFTALSAGHFLEGRNWYKHILLARERERGHEHVCDYYRIGYIICTLKPEAELVLCFSLEEENVHNALKGGLASSIKSALKSDSLNASFYRDLLRSGRQFIVDRKSTNGKTIVAGYHWFADWGRDTMIAMRGLTISTGNQQTSRSILETFFQSIDQGMIPNRFPDHTDDKIEYNTIDATLWLFVATYEYYLKFEDADFITQKILQLKNIIDCHIAGTRHQIHVTSEGFLFGGKDGTQLTWMDAKVDDIAVTPRIGCPVEINALWYNALKIFVFFNRELGLSIDAQHAELINRFESNFERFFINDDGTLYDVVVPGISVDKSLRPNQLFWLSLPFSFLSQEQEQKIFEAVKEKLYTPYGLRTLDPDHEKFEATYQGGIWQRDHAYHQGTVWPFLLFDYFQAFFKLHGADPANKKQVVNELAALRTHFYSEQGIHCLSEVFDGQNPKAGKGCIHQAWSVGAIIKLYTDYQLYEIDASP